MRNRNRDGIAFATTLIVFLSVLNANSNPVLRSGIAPQSCLSFGKVWVQTNPDKSVNLVLDTVDSDTVAISWKNPQVHAHLTHMTNKHYVLEVQLSPVFVGTLSDNITVVSDQRKLAVIPVKAIVEPAPRKGYKS